MSLIQLRGSIHAKTLLHRRFLYLFNQSIIDRLYKDSTEKEIEDLKKIVDQLDLKKLKHWIRKHSSLDLGEKAVTELRSIARSLDIRLWSRLTKMQLITAISKEEDRYEQS